MFSFKDLCLVKLKGLRNGNWRKLSFLDKGLFECALSLAKIRGKIENMNLMVKLAKIIIKLKATIKTEIAKLGLLKAQALKRLYTLKGVFDWCLSLKNWLNEPSYIFWLGLKEIYG